MRVIYTSKGMSKKVWGARYTLGALYTLGARYLSKNTVYSSIHVQSNYTGNMRDHQPSPVTTIRALMLLIEHIKANKQYGM
jgi:hypothetical protein